MEPIPKATKKKRSPAQANKKLALRFWTTLVKRGGICERCGSSGPLDAHHVVRRSRSLVLQTDLENGLALCKPCHFRWHQFELESGPWFVSKFGQDRYDYLMEKKAAGGKVDWAERVEILRSAAEEFEIKL